MRVLFVMGLIVFTLTSPVLAEESTARPESPARLWQTARDAGVREFARGAYQEALAEFEKCVPVAPGLVATGITASDIGAVLNALGRSKESLPWFEKAVAIWRSVPDQADRFAEVALGMADSYRGLGDFRAAEQSFRAGLEVNPSANYAVRLHNRLGDMLREQGRNVEARAQLTAALGQPGTSPMNRIDSLLAIADLDRQIMHWDESKTNWHKALDLAREENAVEYEALALRGLGLTALNQDDMTQAEIFLKRAVAVFDKAPQLVPQQIANTLHSMAAMYFESGRLALAQEAINRALDYIRQDVGTEHPHAGRLMITQSRIYSGLSRFAEARRVAEHAHQIMCAVYGDDSVAAADALGNVARIEHEARDLTAAAQHFERALEIMRKSQAATDQRIVVMMSGYKAVLTDLHRTKEAKKVQSEMSGFGFR